MIIRAKGAPRPSAKYTQMTFQTTFFPVAIQNVSEKIKIVISNYTQMRSLRIAGGTLVLVHGNVFGFVMISDSLAGYPL